MSITRADLAAKIHKALGINTRFTEATPDQVIDTLQTVNDWMNSEGGIGNRLGWVEIDQGSDPDIDEETGLAPWAVHGVVYNCALLVASYFDKQPSAIIQKAAIDGMQTIAARTTYVKGVGYPAGMPRGQGSTYVFGEKYFHSPDPIQTSNDFLEDEGGDLIFSGGGE